MSRSFPIFLAALPGLLAGCGGETSEPSPIGDAPPFVREWARYGPDGGVFTNPTFLAASPDGFVYVADQGQNEIEKYTGAGEFVLKFDTPGGGDDRWFITAMAADVDRLIVVYEGALLYVYDPEGHLMADWRARTDYGGVAIAPNGDILVSGRSGLQRFSAAGDSLEHWDIAPGPISVDADGNVYVARRFKMAETNQVSIAGYTPRGALISEWRVWDEHDVISYTIAAGKSGDLFVAHLAGAVSRYRDDGRLLARWSEVSPIHEPLREVIGVAVGPSGDVYVSDYVHRRVVQYGP